MYSNINEKQLLINSPFIITFSVFHFEISGKDDKDWQFVNILNISVTLQVSQLDISGKDINEIQL